MRLSSIVIQLCAFGLAAIFCLVASTFLAGAVERGTETSVRHALDSDGFDWTEVEAQGLQVILAGTAPDEAARFSAMSTVGGVVDAARIINEMDVVPAREIAPPRFSVEILRNEGGISAIGLIPTGMDRAALIEALEEVAGPTGVADFLESADYPVPKGWTDALGYTILALDRLPRAKVSVDAGRVAIEALAESPEARTELEAALREAAPKAVTVTLEISAPRPVITPFTLRYLIDDRGGRFDACSADTPDTRDRILKAAEAAGLTGDADCTIGLGVPSPEWADAAALSIAALSELGKGTVTLSDADITLAAVEGTDPELFDSVAGELETALPAVFSLHAILPPPPGKTDAGPPEFVATLSPEGQVQLRGRIGDDGSRELADSYAKARFGSSGVHTAARVVSGVPVDWPIRVLAGIEALSRLDHGAVIVAPDSLTVRGTTSREGTRSAVAGFLSERLGETETYELDIAYVPPPPPREIEETPTPEACESEIAETQRTLGKISFEPGSATIAAESIETMDAISEILQLCGEIKLEIQGHTDSQGRTSMNLELSQERADSVLTELRARRILTGNFTAVGYGEEEPIADNKTEDGREANRRIEFRWVRPEPAADHTTTLEAIAAQSAEDGSGDDESGDEADAEEDGDNE